VRLGPLVERVPVHVDQAGKRSVMAGSTSSRSKKSSLLASRSPCPPVSPGRMLARQRTLVVLTATPNS